jgi:D-3-phosphoglycerate dehydrogenase
MKIKILEPDNFSVDAIEYLSNFGEVIKTKDIEHQAEESDVLFVRLGYQLNESFLKKFINLKYIVSPTTGEDHIDKKTLQERNITLLTLKGESQFLSAIPATAEFTWGLILSLTRQIPWAANSVKNGNWDRDAFRGCDLFGKTIALVGYGRIAKIIARYSFAFGMNVKAFDPYVTHFDDEVKECTSLDQMMVETDILSIHVALSEQTHNLINSRHLDKLPGHAIVVNTSRGEILNNGDLLKSLESGSIAAAALDVLPSEREEHNNIKSQLIEYANERDNLLITPHLGGATSESMAMTEMFMAQKLYKLLTPTL